MNNKWVVGYYSKRMKFHIIRDGFSSMNEVIAFLNSEKKKYPTKNLYVYELIRVL